jgi:hypothetical protein
MTAETRAQLDELSRDLSAALQSAWQPRCIAHAFATPRAGEVVFTLQHWIDLEAIRSPLLSGGEVDAEDAIEAAAIFGLDLQALTPEEAVRVLAAIRAAIAEGFAAALKQTPPQGSSTVGTDDGFGDWLPLVEWLLAHYPQTNLATPVVQAFMLLAAQQRRQGWTGAGYALRDLEEASRG